MSLPTTTSPFDRLITEAQSKLFGWIPFDKWVQLHPTETRDKVRGRIRGGRWKLGVHAARMGERDLWIHVANVKALLEGTPPEDAPLP